MSLERLEELSEAPHSFTASLIEAGLLVATGSAGIFGHTSTYEAVIAGLGSLVRAVGDGEAVTTLNFPPVMTKADFEQTGYLESFPNLIGAVRSFSGSEAEHSRLLKTVYSGGDWSDQLHPVDLVLCSAACHPIYRTCTGRLPGGGRRFEVSAYCFRREPSADPARLQAFRMHEHVYVGEASTALAYRDKWVGAAEEILVSLGLNIEPQVATDPFFGRAAVILADRQREEHRKVELVASMPALASSTAAASSNWHNDHFGNRFGIETADGEVAHSSCVGFGLDRIAIALLATHGPNTADWPEATRTRLGLQTPR